MAASLVREADGVSGDHARDYQLGSGDRWYVAMTLPHGERMAAANLGYQGFRSFLPLQRVTLRHARQFRTTLAPVFARYLFLILDLDAQRWRSVNGTRGVARLITDGRRPTAVPSGVVETLALSSDAAGTLVFRQALAIGDRVRLLAGPFADSFGVLERLDGADRVQLMLDLIGGPMKISAPREIVAAAR
ncbi:MAG: transcription termination/antitermination NusG family protein [Roseiarcus sp.]